ncbi:hypothetical protein DH2020_043328 [Rehmannia glutinosa]|uniref:Uncharacterized protein n=1 Tax=Rehmannia glutinosa TaxID=99300 RepID=A0ABR0UKV2_REHGL
MPPQYNEKEGQKSINPTFISWQRQDQLLASWLLSSLSDTMLVLMVGLNTSREIWHTLEKNFASQSRAKFMQYKLQLQTLRKANMSMREYLSKIKACCDNLASAGHIVSEEDQILHILSGLGSEYDPVMVSITSKVDPFSVSDLQTILLSFESRLETSSGSIISNDGSQPSLNTMTTTPGRSFNPSNTRGRGFYQSFRGGRFNTRGGYRGRGGRFQRAKIECQLCHGNNHTVDKCWYRFDPNYNGPNTHNS